MFTVFPRFLKKSASALRNLSPSDPFPERGNGDAVRTGKRGRSPNSPPPSPNSSRRLRLSRAPRPAEGMLQPQPPHDLLHPERPAQRAAASDALADPLLVGLGLRGVEQRRPV